jgi:predicted nucleic acid-binding protein
VKIASSPIYLHASAVAKIYISEPDSDALESALVRRRDLVVSDLAVTELTSAIARRVREAQLAVSQAKRVYRRIQQDVNGGEFHRTELTAAAHREAERLLMGIGRRVPLRAADALHLALAALAGARALITFDRHMTTAAKALGTFELPASE